METVLEEARSSYEEEIVVELQSESPEQVEENVGRIGQWVQQWRADRGITGDQDLKGSEG